MLIANGIRHGRHQTQPLIIVLINHNIVMTLLQLLYVKHILHLLIVQVIVYGLQLTLVMICLMTLPCIQILEVAKLSLMMEHVLTAKCLTKITCLLTPMVIWSMVKNI
jgi:hypothetical protein